MGKHYVPQALLQWFATDELRTHVWMFDRKTRKWSKPAIRMIAQEKDFYPPETERQLTEVEKAGNAALNKLRQRQFLTPEDRMAAAKYLGTAHERVPKRREQVAGLAPKAAEAVLADWQRALDRFEGEGEDSALIARRRKELAVAAVNVRADPLGGGVVDLVRSPWQSEIALKAVYAMHWQVFHLDPQSEDLFIISDNPVSLIGALGVGPSEAQFAFPISRSVCIAGSWFPPVRDGLYHLQADARMTREANRMQAAFAYRFLYSPRKEPWIEKLPD